MSNEEVDKIIAEFMGRSIVKRGHYWFLLDCMGELCSTYIKSLDSLVSVWEKLSVEFSYVDGHFNIHRDNHENDIICTVFHYQKTIQEAAAHATAKAITLLGDQ